MVKYSHKRHNVSSVDSSFSETSFVEEDPVGSVRSRVQSRLQKEEIRFHFYANFLAIVKTRKENLRRKKGEGGGCCWPASRRHQLRTRSRSNQRMLRLRKTERQYIPPIWCSYSHLPFAWRHFLSHRNCVTVAGCKQTEVFLMFLKKSSCFWLVVRRCMRSYTTGSRKPCPDTCANLVYQTCTPVRRSASPDTLNNTMPTFNAQQSCSEWISKCGRNLTDQSSWSCAQLDRRLRRRRFASLEQIDRAWR